MRWEPVGERSIEPFRGEYRVPEMTIHAFDHWTWCEVSGGWAIATWKPSRLRISETAFQPEPSAKAPCTRTMFLTEAVLGTAAEAALAAPRSGGLLDEASEETAAALRGCWVMLSPARSNEALRTAAWTDDVKS